MYGTTSTRRLLLQVLGLALLFGVCGASAMHYWGSGRNIHHLAWTILITMLFYAGCMSLVLMLIWSLQDIHIKGFRQFPRWGMAGFLVFVLVVVRLGYYVYKDYPVSDPNESTQGVATCIAIPLAVFLAFALTKLRDHPFRRLARYSAESRHQGSEDSQSGTEHHMEEHTTGLLGLGLHPMEAD